MFVGHEMIKPANGDYYNKFDSSSIDYALYYTPYYTLVNKPSSDESGGDDKYILLRLDTGLYDYDESLVTIPERLPTRLSIFFINLINSLFERIYYAQRPIDSYSYFESGTITQNTILTRNSRLDANLLRLIDLASPDKGAYTLGNATDNCRGYNLDWHVFALRCLYELVHDYDQSTEYSVSLKNSDGFEALVILPPTINFYNRQNEYSAGEQYDDYCSQWLPHIFGLSNDIEVNADKWRLNGSTETHGSWSLSDLLGDTGDFLYTLQQIYCTWPTFNALSSSLDIKDVAFYLSNAFDNVFPASDIRQFVFDGGTDALETNKKLGWLENRKFTGGIERMQAAGGIVNVYFARCLVRNCDSDMQPNEHHVLTLTDLALAWGKENYGVPQKDWTEWDTTTLAYSAAPPLALANDLAYLTLHHNTDFNTLRLGASRASLFAYCAAQRAVDTFAPVGLFALPMMLGLNGRLKCYVNTYNVANGVQIEYTPYGTSPFDPYAGAINISKIETKEPTPDQSTHYDNELHWKLKVEPGKTDGHADYEGYGSATFRPAVEQGEREFAGDVPIDQRLFDHDTTFTLNAPKSRYHGIKVQCWYIETKTILAERLLSDYQIQWSHATPPTLGRATVLTTAQFPIVPSGKDLAKSLTTLDLAGLEWYGPHDLSKAGAPDDSTDAYGVMLIPFRDTYSASVLGSQAPTASALKQAELKVANPTETAKTVMQAINDHKGNIEGKLFDELKKYLDPSKSHIDSMTINSEEQFLEEYKKFPDRLKTMMETYSMDELVTVTNFASELAWDGVPKSYMCLYFVMEEFRDTDGTVYPQGSILAYRIADDTSSSGCFLIDEAEGTAELINDGYPAFGIWVHNSFDSKINLTNAQMQGQLQYGFTASSKINYLIGAFAHPWFNGPGGLLRPWQ